METKQNESTTDIDIVDATIILIFAIIFDIVPYFMIADKRFISIFTFDLILNHEKKLKDISDNENARKLLRNEQGVDDGAVDREAILQGEFGEEIMNLRNASSTLPSIMVRG